jgi:hypothetical protein
MTLVAMVVKIREFHAQEAWLVFAFALLLLVLALWLVGEGIVALLRIRREVGQPSPVSAGGS